MVSPGSYLYIMVIRIFPVTQTHQPRITDPAILNQGSRL
jgi:hypothetical protein